ncbi:MAG: enoyl-CoA hydratase-related protein [Actinomycetota bacterium]|nr:enoyl-CoA hydratase-related protein [Actinomycetota bacterium]
MGEFVNLEVAGSGVATLRLDRPKLNPLNRQVATEIGEAVDAAAADDNVRALVVWGGERVFAAGADIKEMGERDAVTMYRYIGYFQDVFTRLENLPVITIAAINGYALGGGCELALACDFRICAEDSQLGQPEILLGVIPGAGGTQRLPRLIGSGRAKDLIYSGRFVPAAEAVTIGLVNEVVPAAEVYPTAVRWAERYAAGPRVALMAAKQAIQNGLEVDQASGLLIERQAFAALFATEDQKIGMTSFVEEGPGKAKFVGR